MKFLKLWISINKSCGIDDIGPQIIYVQLS